MTCCILGQGMRAWQIVFRLQTTTAREQKNMDIILQLQEASASRFSALQLACKSSSKDTLGLIHQSGGQLLDLMQKRQQDADTLQVTGLKGNLL